MRLKKYIKDVTEYNGVAITFYNFIPDIASSMFGRTT
jgi:hypothetical protein